MDAIVALRFQQRLDLLFLEVLRHRYRERDDQARVPRGLGAGGELLVYRGRRIAPHRSTAAAAKELTRAREKKLQVVVQLGHRPDRRAGRAHGVGLVDGDRRRDPLDRIDLGFVHAVEELPRVRAEGLDVAPLPLGVERVENERGFPRPRHPGDDDELARGDLEREVLEVVLAGAADDDRGAVATVLHAAIVKGVSSGAPSLPCSAGAAGSESSLQKLLHCRSRSRFEGYIPVARRRLGVSAAPMQVGQHRSP